MVTPAEQPVCVGPRAPDPTNRVTPIGLVVAALATRVLPATGRRAGRFDLPGAITATAGVAALVYGLSNAATTPGACSSS